MLLVKTVVKESPIAGVGLFADQEIKKGTAVWQYTPETCLVLEKEQFQVLLESFHKTEKQLIHYYLTYTYYQAKLNGLILCLDNGRFVNHSEKPSLCIPSNMPENVAWQYSVACRDICKGEEITENYSTYDTCDWLNDLCQQFDIQHYQFETMSR